MEPQRYDVLWRILFLVSLTVAPILYSEALAKPIVIGVTSSLPALIIDSFLAGFGACLAKGCTSGHGVCGLGCLSRRSLVATVSIMVTGIATVYLIHHALGLAI